MSSKHTSRKRRPNKIEKSSRTKSQHLRNSKVVVGLFLNASVKSVNDDAIVGNIICLRVRDFTKKKL